MRFSLPRWLARPPLTAPIPTAPYTNEALAGSGGAFASWLIAHVPVPPHAWEAKFSAANFPLLPRLEQDVLEVARRRHAELRELEIEDRTSTAGAGRARAQSEGDLPLEPYMVIAWDGHGSTSALTKELGALRVDWQVPGRAPFSFEYSSSSGKGPVDLPPIQALAKADKADPIELYVCTHGKRDCRCADVGGALVDGIQAEIVKRGLGAKVAVKEVSHLGGHKYAANALCFPSHNLLGNLRPADAPLLVDTVTAQPLVPTAASPAKLLPHWRGVTGLTKSAMLSLHADAAESSTGIVPPWEQGEIETVPVGEEVPLVFRSWEGDEAEFEGRVGETLMDLGKRLELGAIEGVCGGVLECATCHCYLAPEPTPAPVKEPSEGEEDMLWTAMEKTEDSRLGCQIVVDQALSDWCAKGGRIGLPRY